MLTSEKGLLPEEKNSVKKIKGERPWGYYEILILNQISTVKIIKVRPDEELSLQFHRNRDEYWKVISGRATVVIGDRSIKAEKGEEFFIQRGVNHRIVTEDSPVEILEISFGYFDEEDIIRVEDKYNRD